MIKLRNKELLGRVEIFRPSTYDEDTEEHITTRRSNNINHMHYVGYLQDVLGVVKGDDDIYYIELDVAFSEDYIVSDDFRPNDLTRHSAILLGSNHEEMLDYADNYEDEHYEEGVYNSVLRLPFITFTKILKSLGNLSILDLADNYVSNPVINVSLSAVEEYTRNFSNHTGGINFYMDDNRFSSGAWIPIGSGYYIKVSDNLIKSDAYVKYVEETTYWTGSAYNRVPITRKVMDLLNEMEYTKVEITDDDGSVNIYPINKTYNRGKEYTALINTALYGGSGGFYHPFLDDALDIIKLHYVSEPIEIKSVSGILNRSVIEHFFNNTDMYITELRLSDKIKLIK